MSGPMYDVRQDQYPTVIREMIRHENDVTNHRIMWLLVGQEFIANGSRYEPGRMNHRYSALDLVSRTGNQAP
jgi:hypothetical protein